MRSENRKADREPKSEELRVHITPAEMASLRRRYGGTTYKVFSEFIRALLRNEPMVKRYRNQSLDDVYEELVDIKNAAEEMARKDGANDSDGRLFWEGIKDLLIKIYQKCGREERE